MGTTEGAKGGLLEKVEQSLRKLGIDIETACDIESAGKGVKCVVVAPGLGRSVREMEDSPRDHVVMVRVDAQTSKALDAWVETGAVRSRSEAAALFIREGLKVRASELGKLRSALDEVEAARQRLRDRAQEVFGDQAEEPEASGSAAPGGSPSGAAEAAVDEEKGPGGP
jgi:hypothetical protein